MDRIEKKKKTVGGSKEVGRGGGGGEKKNSEILSAATSTQIPNHKTNKTKDISKKLSKEAIRGSQWG